MNDPFGTKPGILDHQESARLRRIQINTARRTLPTSNQPGSELYLQVAVLVSVADELSQELAEEEVEARQAIAYLPKLEEELRRAQDHAERLESRFNHLDAVHSHCE